jgi:hypothetical protein
MPTLPKRAAAMDIVWGELGLALHLREIWYACEGIRGGRGTGRREHCATPSERMED